MTVVPRVIARIQVDGRPGLTAMSCWNRVTNAQESR